MKDLRKYFGGLGNRLFQMAYIYAQMRKGEISDIYVQNPKYFYSYEEELRTMLSDDIGKTDKIAIHVRRGANPTNPNEPKYCENPFHVNLCATDYYEKAMAEFPNEKFLVFSDDPLWCEDKWKDKPNVEIRVGQSEIEDLNEMASCKGHIIANSSYSWWGAFLSPHKGKVICPKNWYADGITRTVCLKEWKPL